MNRQAEADIRRKTKVLEHAKQSGNVSHTCRKFGVSRDSFYRWKKQLETSGPVSRDATIFSSQPIADIWEIGNWNDQTHPAGSKAESLLRPAIMSLVSSDYELLPPLRYSIYG